MKRWLIFITTVVLGIVLWSKNRQEEPPVRLTPAQPNLVETLESEATAPPSTAPSHPLATRLGDPTIAPEKEPAIVYELMTAWRRNLGRFPTAEDNRSLVKQMTQSTPPLLNANNPRINTNGELTDAWKTPYYFHHLSANHLEVRSAGPDRTLYTEDDLLFPPHSPTEGRGPPRPEP